MTQLNEQQIIDSFFGDSFIGTFVDCGAFDGITNSNTFQLEERGWYGACIEPSPYAFNLLSLRRKNSWLFNVALVGDESQTETSFTVFDNAPQLNGIAPSIEKINHESASRGLVINSSSITVTATTLTRVMEMSGLGHIDFVSIDTEGNELEVLKGFDIELHKPRLLCIELNDFRNDAITDYLKRFGYTVYASNEINTFFCKS
jgi:FkbM family methyltransferase